MVEENKLSIIVSAYNEGKNISKCLYSLQNQQGEYKYEVIIVDDGSKDESVSIMDNYAQKNDNFKVIHKKNGGSISARYEGAKNASGNYITLIDGDDFVSKDYVKTVYSIINENKAEFYILNDFVTDSIKKSFRLDKQFLDSINYLSMEEAYNWVLTGKAGNVWDKIYKTKELCKALKDNISRIFYGEDIYINVLYLAHVTKVKVENKAIYYHYVSSPTSGSITQKNFKKIDDINAVYLKVYYLYQNGYISKNNLNDYLNMYISNIAEIVGDLIKLGVKNKKISKHLTELAITNQGLKIIQPINFKKQIYIWCIKNKYFYVLFLINRLKIKNNFGV